MIRARRKRSRKFDRKAGIDGSSRSGTVTVSVALVAENVYSFRHPFSLKN
jgi:hypothetical protein